MWCIWTISHHDTQKDRTIMSQIQDNNHGPFDDHNEKDIEQQLLQGLSLNETPARTSDTRDALSRTVQDDEEQATQLSSDIQGSLGLFAEAAQDMATATVELSLGRHFACVDFCNQAVEKAAQAVSLLRYGRRATYDHNLRTLGSYVGAPDEILDDMERLTPFHPETFYMDTPPEEADEVINAEQASSYITSARKVLRWARNLVLNR
jgi:HEPN domain-containing protein